MTIEIIFLMVLVAFDVLLALIFLFYLLRQLLRSL